MASPFPVLIPPLSPPGKGKEGEPWEPWGAQSGGSAFGNADKEEEKLDKLSETLDSADNFCIFMYTPASRYTAEDMVGDSVV